MKNGILKYFAFLIILAYSCSTEEKYPSVHFERVNYNFNSVGCDSTNFECVQIKINSINLSNPNNPIRDSIQNGIDNFILAPTTDTAAFKDVYELRDSLFNNYKRTRIELPDMKIGYYLQRDANAETDTLGIFALRFFESAFYGGAHPNSFTILENYDLKDGHKISLDELLNPGFGNELNKIAEINFRKLKNIQPGESLEDGGFWFEGNKFELNRNFLITRTGLLFVFNAYEIAPYAMGPTELLLDYSQFKNLINKKGILGRFVN